MLDGGKKRGWKRIWGEDFLLGWLLCWAIISLGGCFPTTQLVVEKGGKRVSSLSLWPKQRPSLLFRGLYTGMSPREVQKRICQHWSLGTCESLRPHSLGNGYGEAIFSLREQSSPFPCQHMFVFWGGGLQELQTVCTAHYERQVKAWKMRYHRWFGKPTSQVQHRGLHRFRWKDEKDGVLHLFFTKGVRLVSMHRDERRLWMRELVAIQPLQSESPPHVWKVWQRVPRHVRREVLENLLRMIRLWREGLRGSSWRALDAGSAWTPALASRAGCQPFPKEAADWTRYPWRVLQFSPAQPVRLSYKLRFLRPNMKRFPKYMRNKRMSWFLSRQVRSFWLGARGCGFRFSVEGAQSGKRLHLFRMSVTEDRATQDIPQEGGSSRTKMLPIK